jgi:hypothetical protein
MWHAWGRGEVTIVFWLGSPKVRDHYEDLGVDGKIILRWTLRRQGSIGRAGIDWLRIGFSGGLLGAR